MHTPPQSNSKGPRRSSKQNKQRDVAQRSVQSDNDAYQINNHSGDHTPSNKNKPKQRRKSQAQKQSGALSEAGEYSDGVTYKNLHHTEKARATPIKQQAYAGPTFHQSPAASALPMPSFYSRSVPNPGSIDSIAEVSDAHTSGTSHNSEIPAAAVGGERQSTPLDFLFDAARKAQNTPHGGSPAPRQHLLSPANNSPASGSPGIREPEGDFPFELDTPDRTPTGGRSGVSTPFKDRLEAARSPQSTPDSNQNMTEDERRAKTAALKKALMSPQGFDQLTDSFRDTNPFNAKNAPVNATHPDANTPNLNIPNNQYPPNPHSPYYSQRTKSPNRINHSQASNRPPSSSLRNVYEPEFTAQSTHNNQGGQDHANQGSKPASQPNFASIYGGSKPHQNQQEPQQPNMQQGLHDLRKVLNLDLMGRG